MAITKSALEQYWLENCECYKLFRQGYVLVTGEERSDASRPEGVSCSPVNPYYVKITNELNLGNALILHNELINDFVEGLKWHTKIEDLRLFINARASVWHKLKILSHVFSEEIRCIELSISFFWKEKHIFGSKMLYEKEKYKKYIFETKYLRSFREGFLKDREEDANRLLRRSMEEQEKRNRIREFFTHESATATQTAIEPRKL